MDSPGDADSADMVAASAPVERYDLDPDVAPASSVLPTDSPPRVSGELPAPGTQLFSCVEDFYGYLMLRGQHPLTEEHYDMARHGFNISSPTPLPSLSKVRRSIAPLVQPWLLTTSQFEADLPDGDGPVQVQFVAPSTHVRRDMMFADTYEKFLAAEKRPQSSREPEFVDSPFFQDRSAALLSDKLVSRFSLGDADVDVGDVIDVVLLAPHPAQRVKVQKAYFCSHAAGVAPGDGVHAGDFVVVCEGVNDTGASGWVVGRHWLSDELPALCWFPEDGAAVQAVRQLRVVLRGHAGQGGAGSADRPRRDISGMKDGMPFIIVSLCFNTDDFQSRVGKRASLEGVYMSYLSWRFQDRRNSHACRVIAVAPARVDSDLVLEAVTADLVEGAKSGWLCRRPDGAAVRVFADVAMFVGDYLQVTKSSKMMGYGAKSPCPLCSYRAPGIGGCRYGLDGSSADVGMARTSRRTRHICRAVGEACRSPSD